MSTQPQTQSLLSEQKPSLGVQQNLWNSGILWTSPGAFEAQHLQTWAVVSGTFCPFRVTELPACEVTEVPLWNVFLPGVLRVWPRPWAAEGRLWAWVRAESPLPRWQVAGCPPQGFSGGELALCRMVLADE